MTRPVYRGVVGSATERTHVCIATSLFVREFEFIAVAALHLALVQTGAVVGVDAVAVCDEEYHIAGLASVDLPELPLNFPDPLFAFRGPVTLQQAEIRTKERGTQGRYLRHAASVKIYLPPLHLIFLSSLGTAKQCIACIEQRL